MPPLPRWHLKAGDIADHGRTDRQGQEFKRRSRRDPGEKIDLSEENRATDGVISIPGKVKTVDYLGQQARYFVEANGRDWQVINPIDAHPHKEGADIFMHIAARNCVLLPGHQD